MKFLVTGAAGFIGFNVVQRLCNAGHDVIGIDNLNAELCSNGTRLKICL